MNEKLSQRQVIYLIKLIEQFMGYILSFSGPNKHGRVGRWRTEYFPKIFGCFHLMPVLERVTTDDAFGSVEGRHPL